MHTHRHRETRTSWLARVLVWSKICITFYIQQRSICWAVCLLWGDVPKSLKQAVCQKALRTPGGLFKHFANLSLPLTIHKCLFDRLNAWDDLCQVSKGGIWTSHHLKRKTKWMLCSNLWTNPWLRIHTRHKTWAKRESTDEYKWRPVQFSTSLNCHTVELGKNPVPELMALIEGPKSDSFVFELMTFWSERASGNGTLFYF